MITCDGRSEEGLAGTAFVPSLWDGWMASNHVMRVIPMPETLPGLLYLALRSPYVQCQLKAAATGSVVDALSPDAIASVVLPDVGDKGQQALNDKVEGAWEAIAESLRATSVAVAHIESRIVAGYQV